jgi:hypothetical protein
MKRRLTDIAIWTLCTVTLWFLAVAGRAILNYIGTWESLITAIIVGVIFGSFPRFRQWIMRC